MTQSQLNHAVATTTGESLHTIQHLGFGLLTPRAQDFDPEDLCLVLDCPFCRQPVAYPGATQSGTPVLAECDRCDVFFDFDPTEVYATGVSNTEAVTVEAA